MRYNKEKMDRMKAGIAKRHQIIWVDDDHRRLEIEALQEYCSKEDSYNIEGFTCQRGYTSKAFEEACKNYEDLMEARQIAVEALASRRDTGCLTKKLDGAYGKATLILYSPKYREYLKESKENQGQVINLIKQQPWSDSK